MVNGIHASIVSLGSYFLYHHYHLDGRLVVFPAMCIGNTLFLFYYMLASSFTFPSPIF